jgi:uncharacterized membrane protein
MIMKNTDLVRAMTPIVIALTGGLIGAAALLLPGISDSKSVSALGLATSAITGASGLAQSPKSEERE